VSARQKTILKEASVVGPGLFSGETASLTFAPADIGAGITFLREQDGKVASIPALVQNVLKRPRRTCLRNGTLFVETVEHCMAALAGMGVDNAIVRVSGGSIGELPAGDGSSRMFVEALQEAGIVEQDAELKPLIIRKPVQVSYEARRSPPSRPDRPA
jgi:UDP-3-O-acyl-N-acetylglucosamine deacetylase